MTDGVMQYTIGTLTAPIPFYDGVADCQHCPMCWFDKYFGLYRCRVNDYFPRLMPSITLRREGLATRPAECPVLIEQKEDV